MTHFTPDELIDVVDGALAPTRRAHLDTCDECRREAATLHAVLGEVRAVDVPQPSPLFWDHFSLRVRTAITAENSDAPARRWFQWPVLAPLAGLALLVLALVSAVPLGTAPTESERAAVVAASATNANSEVDVEEEWALLAVLFEDIDFDAATDAGIVMPRGAADRAVQQLTLGEQQELMRLLQNELRAGG